MRIFMTSNSNKRNWPSTTEDFKQFIEGLGYSGEWDEYERNI